MSSRAQHAARPGRESLSKRLGRTARLIALRDGCACVYCVRTAEQSGAALHLDHLTPRSRGGADAPTNLVLACRRCNCARQALSLPQWSAYAATLGLHVDPRRVRRLAARRLPEAA